MATNDEAFALIMQENLQLKRKVEQLEVELASEKSKRIKHLTEVADALDSNYERQRPPAISIPPSDSDFEASDSHDESGDEDESVDECGWCGIAERPCHCDLGLVCPVTALEVEYCHCGECAPKSCDCSVCKEGDE